MKISCFYYALFLLLLQNASFAQNNFSAANQAFEQGDFITAEKLYQQVLADSVGSFELYHNLGTTYCKLNDLAAARLYLEKASLIKPGHAGNQNNIKWIKTELSEFIAPIPEFFITRLWKKAGAVLPFKIWHFFSLFCLCMAAFLLFNKLFSNRNGFKSKFIIPGIILAIVFAALSFFLGMSRFNQLNPSNQHVVFKSNSTLKERPEAEAEIIQTLIPGSKVKTESTLGEWNKITVEDGSKGWTKGDNLVEISL